MKQILAILAAIILAILQMVLFFTIGHINIQLSMVAIFGLAYFFSGHRNIALIILLGGSFILDMFSPYRPGIYLLSIVVVLSSVDYLVTRSLEISNPLIMLMISLLAFAILGLIPFIINQSWLIFLANILVNTIITLIISLIFSHMFINRNSVVRISEDVSFR